MLIQFKGEEGQSFAFNPDNIAYVDYRPAQSQIVGKDESTMGIIFISSGGTPLYLRVSGNEARRVWKLLTES